MALIWCAKYINQTSMERYAMMVNGTQADAGVQSRTDFPFSS